MPAHPPQCVVCRKPLARPGYPPLCDVWRCRVKFWDSERPRQRERLRAAEEAQRQRRERLRARRDAAAAEAGIFDPESFLPIPLPASHKRLVPLPPERREAFLAHLRSTVELLRESPGGAGLRDARGDDFSPCPAELHATLARACALCRGYCCRCGGEHAYLNETTLRRYLAAHPGAEPEAAFADYAARVPAVGHENSCVFHAENGCGLPRALRSDTCNAFECAELAALTAQLGRSPDLRVFLAAEDRGDIVRSCFVPEERHD